MPDAVTQCQLVEAKVDGLVAIGIRGGLDRIIGFVAFTGGLCAGGQADGAAGDDNPTPKCGEGSAVVMVVAGAVEGVGVLAAAVDIAIERAAQDKVGVGDDDQVARGGAQAGRQIGKGIVATAGKGAGNAAVAGAKAAIASALSW
ncbi:MAG: hypothetical protein R3E79_22505 [Caldilineaceae bacterium]